MTRHKFTYLNFIILPTLIMLFCSGCSNEDENLEGFEYINHPMVPHLMTQREKDIMESCQATMISDSVALSEHVLGTWRLIGHSNTLPVFFPEYSYLQITFGPSIGHGLMEYFSPEGIILTNAPFRWTATSNQGSIYDSSLLRAWIISEPYLHDVVGLRFCEEYAFLSSIDRPSKLIFQKQD